MRIRGDAYVAYVPVQKLKDTRTVHFVDDDGRLLNWADDFRGIARRTPGMTKTLCSGHEAGVAFASRPSASGGDPIRKNKNSPSYSGDEKRTLLEQVASGARPICCPRCGGVCGLVRMPPRRDVSYVRNRIVVRCPACFSSLAADWPAVAPASEERA